VLRRKGKLKTVSD